MMNTNTFGVHFVLRTQRPKEDGKFPVYARITVNQTRSEFSLKHAIFKEDWNFGKGIAKTRNEELREFNSFLQEIQGRMARHYRELLAAGKPLNATAVKNSFIGIVEEKPDHTLLWLVRQHNTMMQKILKPGSMKNYYTTERYLKLYLSKYHKRTDIPLKELNCEFITTFEFFVRNNALKENDPCTNNGAMKHLERLKKMVAWALRNEWIKKNPFVNFHLKFKRKERDFLNANELSTLESQELENAMLVKVRDFFVFCCYTGLSYIDLMELKPEHILVGIDNIRWIKTCRAKTEVAVNVPLLTSAQAILEKFINQAGIPVRETIFPWISNQEINRSLKVIAEICGIRKYLTFHLARHTFATTVTLMNGVPIETISKMLGHTKISTTMIYARVSQSKIGMDMELLQNKLDAGRSPQALKAVK